VQTFPRSLSLGAEQRRTPNERVSKENCKRVLATVTNKGGTSPVLEGAVGGPVKTKVDGLGGFPKAGQLNGVAKKK